MNKPHIVWNGWLWVCYGDGVYAGGETPSDAYECWLKSYEGKL